MGARDAEDFVGKYYSREWIRKNILRQTEEDMDKIDKQIKDEIAEGIIVSTSGQNQQAMPGTGGQEDSSPNEEQQPSPQPNSERNITIGEVVPPPGQE